MLIKSIYLKNFRQYKGENTFVFSTDKVKNVTVILGNNTLGKTTLLQAFLWCLYGETSFPNKESLLLNIDIANELNVIAKSDVVVELAIIFKEYEYVIKRQQEFKKYINGTVGIVGTSSLDIEYKNEIGETISVESDYNKNDIINNILPKELSDYFFFDTERITNVERKDLKNSVKTLLKLNVQELAIEHLGGFNNKPKTKTVLEKFNSDITSKTNDETINANYELAKLNQSEFNCQKEVESYDNEINKYANEIKKLEDKLRSFDETKRDQQEKDKKNIELTKFNNLYKEKINKFFKNFGSNALKFFMQPLLETAEIALNKMEIKDVVVKDLTKNTIDDIIRRGKCICGCNINIGSKEYNTLINLLHFVPPESISQTVKTYKDTLSLYKENNSSKKILDELNDTHSEILMNQEHIEELEKDIELLSKKLLTVPDIGIFEANLIDAKNKQKIKQNKRDQTMQQIGQIKKEQDKYRKIIFQNKISNERNKKIEEYIRYTEKVLEVLKDNYRKREKAVLELLREKVKNIFDKMYSGKRIVEISDDYNIELKTLVNGKIVDTDLSEGLARVKNFAFIAGLVELAKEQLKSDSKYEELNSEKEPYPLVMDAPFSNTDEEHTKTISKYLPEVAEQVIMFVMEKDWKFAEQVLQDNLGKKYYLQKVSETYTRIESEEVY